MTLTPGQKLGPYEIIEAAGAGGMGEVYRAKDTRLDRTVAIKVLPNRTVGNADLRTRFEREARAISSLNHPHICTLHDVGQQDEVDYLVMEYIEGEALSDRLKRGPMEVDEALRIAGQIAGALDSAHRQGLIHRDLKPANVMLTRDGAKLLDFGLAKLKVAGGVVEGISGITQTTPLTGAGTIIGTLQYMAPEQLEGAEADARSDIFAFGALLYEMVTGQRAFEGKSHASLIASIMGSTPPPVSQVKPLTPSGLDRLIKKCLAKEPDDRWQSARDMADELRWIAQSGSLAGIPAPLSAKRRMRFRLAWGVAAFAIVAAGVLGWLYVQRIMTPVPVVRSEISAPEGVAFDGLAGGGIALAPDGSQIAFTGVDTSVSTGESRLFVRSLNSIVALPLPGTEGADFPFWSPDSKQIAFFAGRKLKKILASGGPALTICDAQRGRGGSWNDDDVIVFAPEQEGIMHRVVAAGGESQPLTTLDSANEDFAHRWPVFLPDNDHFLFFNRTSSSVGSEKDAICLSSLSEPSTVVRLINTKSDVVYADGRILFMRDDILMAQPFDAGSLELTGDAVPIAEKVSYVKNFSRGIFSTDTRGGLVYRQGEVARGSRMLIYTAEGKVIDSIGSTEMFSSFALSHTGDRLAITIQDQATSNDDIWVYDMNRRLRTRFTFDADNDFGPVWSPDDTRIVWRSDRTGAHGLYTKRTDIADTARPVVLIEGLFWPWQITPDNRDVLYSVRNAQGHGDLMAVGLDGEADPRVLISNEFDNWGATVSSDGRWMAYASNESGSPQIYVTPYPSLSSKWQVSIDGGIMPAWNEAGDKLYYLDLKGHFKIAEIDGRGDVCRVGKIDGLFEVDAEESIVGLLEDGRRFLFNTTLEMGDPSRVVYVQNWAQELKD